MAKTPPPLKIGDTIGVMAPSSYVERADIEASAAALEARGYRVMVHPQTYMRNNQSAGTHKDKLDAFHALIRDPSIHAIWTAGGGNRCTHIIDDLDYALIKDNPKAVIGFSDVTALLNALYARAGIASYHAPVFKQLHNHQNLDDTLMLLGQGTGGASFDISLQDANIIKGGDTKGYLIGGNLSLFQYLPETLGHNFCDGGILFLEDCHEELSRIDRMLLHLKRTGVFDRVSGLVFGEFTHLNDSARPFGFTLRDIIIEHTQDLDIPIIINAPFGHGGNLSPMRVGGICELNITNLTLSLHHP